MTKSKKLIAAAALAGVTLAAVPTVSTATASTETEQNTASDSSQSTKFEAAMQNAAKPNAENEDVPDVQPLAIPAIIVGAGAREGAKWAAKQVASGALKEGGRRLAGTL